MKTICDESKFFHWNIQHIILSYCDFLSGCRSFIFGSQNRESASLLNLSTIYTLEMKIRIYNCLAVENKFVLVIIRSVLIKVPIGRDWRLNLNSNIRRRWKKSAFNYRIKNSIKSRKNLMVRTQNCLVMNIIEGFRIFSVQTKISRLSIHYLISWEILFSL